MMMPKCHDPCGKKVRTKTCVDLLNSLIVMASWAFYPGLASALTRRVKSDPGPKNSLLVQIVILVCSGGYLG